MNSLFQNECQVTTYVLAAAGKLGLDSLNWDPLVLRDAFEASFSCKLSQRAFDKLMAGVVMVGTNLFEKSVETFLACTAVCNDKPVKSSTLAYVNLKDCCWSVFSWEELLGDQPKDFDSDIVLYIQGLMNLNGVYQLPDYMSFANLPDDKITAIQNNLIMDKNLFEAYSQRQLNNVADLNAYVRDRQRQLVLELQQLKSMLPGYMEKAA